MCVGVCLCETASMKCLQFLKDGLMSTDDIFIHIINCPYTVITVGMKSFGRALHLHGLISCMLAVHCSKNHHREQALDRLWLIVQIFQS